MNAAGYRRIDDVPGTGRFASLAASARAVFALCRWNLRVLFRHWVFWAIFALGLFHFLLQFAIVYTKAQLDVQQPAFRDFLANFMVTGSGRAYRDFLHIQSRAVMLLLAYSTVLLITGDFRAGGIVFYLSKPLSRAEYVLGKILALAAVAAMLTLIPGLTLFIEYGLFSESISYWIENPRIGLGIVAYSLMIMAVFSILAAALGVWCRRATPFVMSWCAVFIVLPVLGELLGSVFRRTDLFRLMNLWLDIRLLADRVFGRSVYRTVMPDAAPAAIALCLATALAIFVLARKVRPVEAVG